MVKKKVPLTTEQKKRKVERQRERRNERKVQLIALGVPNPSKYYNSEKAFNQVVEQRKKEIKREQKRKTEKQRQERNIEKLKEKGVHESYFNSLKRKSQQFIDFISAENTPEYFKEKPKKTKNKKAPTNTINIQPDTLLLAWWDKAEMFNMKDVASNFFELSNEGLKTVIQNNVAQAETASAYKGGRLDFGTYDPFEYEGIKRWYMTTGASTESLQKFDLHQLLAFLATGSFFINQDQIQQFIAWNNDIRNNIVPKAWQEYIPLLDDYQEVIKIKPKKRKK